MSIKLTRMFDNNSKQSTEIFIYPISNITLYKRHTIFSPSGFFEVNMSLRDLKKRVRERKKKGGLKYVCACCDAN